MIAITNPLMIRENQFYGINIVNGAERVLVTEIANLYSEDPNQPLIVVFQDVNCQTWAMEGKEFLNAHTYAGLDAGFADSTDE